MHVCVHGNRKKFNARTFTAFVVLLQARMNWSWYFSVVMKGNNL
jgi:hypothetical protein